MKKYKCTCEIEPMSHIATLHDETCAIWLLAMYQNELAEKRHVTTLPLDDVQELIDAVRAFDEFVKLGGYNFQEITAQHKPMLKAIRKLDAKEE